VSIVVLDSAETEEFDQADCQTLILSTSPSNVALLMLRRSVADVRATTMSQHVLTTPLRIQSSRQLPNTSGRIKFTPERIEQVRNLVERGKSREEIAELVGVTVGSLQVTCSRLGISLRRRRFDNGIHMRYSGGPHSNGGSASAAQSKFVQPPSNDAKQAQAEDEQDQTVGTYDEQSLRGSVNFSIKFQYNGVERTTPVPLTRRAIQQLALEAGLRDVRIGELVGQVIAATAERNLFQTLLASS
jgi:hypothetical protein